MNSKLRLAGVLRGLFECAGRLRALAALQGTGGSLPAFPGGWIPGSRHAVNKYAITTKSMHATTARMHSARLAGEANLAVPIENASMHADIVRIMPCRGFAEH